MLLRQTDIVPDNQTWGRSFLDFEEFTMEQFIFVIDATSTASSQSGNIVGFSETLSSLHRSEDHKSILDVEQFLSLTLVRLC